MCVCVCVWSLLCMCVCGIGLFLSCVCVCAEEFEQHQATTKFCTIVMMEKGGLQASKPHLADNRLFIAEVLDRFNLWVQRLIYPGEA